MSSSSISTPIVGRGLETNSIRVIGRSTLRRRRALIVRPRREQTAEVRDELLVLVRRKRRAHGLDNDPVELRTLHPRHRQLVDVSEVALAEFTVAVDLELPVGDAPVSRELLLVAQVGPVGNREVLL